VQEFLRTHPDFSLDHAGQYVSKNLVSEDGYIETFPHRHEMDGSFAARLIRKGS
jgi:16S rRNA (cytosine967-C5)-methyltransferase